ncbi:MAG TPA: DUF2948 family protein [Hyphomicrobiaceae bacterium]|jgi:hypothetical protein|nr:DUF2948 family protein [Hyphomicrobiaceae bacterium]
MAELKLIALDSEDLSVLSAHLQDAVLQVGDLTYLPHEKRFAAVVNRFDWVDAINGSSTKQSDRYTRRRAALRFERVLDAKLQGVDLRNKATVLSLLAISFEPREAPAGDVTLHFANGAAIRLSVECIEAEIRDLGPAWGAKSMPAHPDDTTNA